MAYEKVTRPAHYGSHSGQDALDVIIDFNLNFCLGNVVKYVIRAGKKPGESSLDDLRKAREYIDREIEAKVLEQNMAAVCREIEQAGRSDLQGIAARESVGPEAFGLVVVPESSPQSSPSKLFYSLD